MKVEVFKNLEQCVTEKFTLAYCGFGWCYQHGWGTEINFKEAFRYYGMSKYGNGMYYTYYCHKRGYWDIKAR